MVGTMGCCGAFSTLAAAVMQANAVAHSAPTHPLPSVPGCRRWAMWCRWAQHSAAAPASPPQCTP